MKQKYDGMTVTIPSFENYNGRKDIKKCSWLRLENAISASEAMFGLDAAERYVFVEILCRASEKQQNAVRINVDYLAQRAGATAAQVCSSLSKLLANGTLEKREQIRPDSIGSERTAEVIARPRPGNEGSNTDLALTDERDERDGPDETDEQDEVSSQLETATIIDALKPFDPDSKLELTFLQRKVSPDTQRALLDAYPDPKWIAQQTFKALAWEAMNPHKRKRNFARFLGNWLSRGWDDHTSKLPSRSGSGRSATGYQRPVGAHERDDDLDAVIEQIKTETLGDSTGQAGGLNAAAY